MDCWPWWARESPDQVFWKPSLPDLCFSLCSQARAPSCWFSTIWVGLSSGVGNSVTQSYTIPRDGMVWGPVSPAWVGVLPGMCMCVYECTHMYLRGHFNMATPQSMWKKAEMAGSKGRLHVGATGPLQKVPLGLEPEVGSVPGVAGRTGSPYDGGRVQEDRAQAETWVSCWQGVLTPQLRERPGKH